MALVRVSFEVEVPDDMSYDEMLSWLRFSFGDNGSMKRTHPAMDSEPELISGTFDAEYR